MANYMADVAKLLGVEIGEEFKVCRNGEATVKLTENGLKILTVLGPLIDNANDVCLSKILTGEYIINRGPWKPKRDEFYWNVRLEDNIYLTKWMDDVIDYNNYKLGNCYRTKKEAEENRDKWSRFYASDEVLEVW